MVSCLLLQVYEDWDCFKVNDVLELYGILSVDPALSVLNHEDRWAPRWLLLRSTGAEGVQGGCRGLPYPETACALSAADAQGSCTPSCDVLGNGVQIPSAWTPQYLSKKQSCDHVWKMCRSPHHLCQGLLHFSSLDFFLPFLLVKDL